MVKLCATSLAHAASFLAAPSRALFAIALDENFTINERSSAIVGGNQWDILDFGCIEKEVAENLTDSDIERVLLCIDAVNNVKRLKLTNCTNITGTCLEPLRGSTMIEQIDLSPDCQYPEPPISCDHVLPILDSMIETEDCALMHLHFPPAWREERSTDSDFHAFIGRYNEMRAGREETRCFECNHRLPHTGDKWISTVNADTYGTQNHTCYDCLKHYCHQCEFDTVIDAMLNECEICKREYCQGCSMLTYCSGCDYDICDNCNTYECVKCYEYFCSECIDENESLRKCYYCDKFCCRKCYDDEAVDLFHTCSRCDAKCCKGCGLQRCQQGELHCAGCIKESVPVLEHERLQEENEELKVEMETLKRQIKDLKHENDELRSRNIE